MPSDGILFENNVTRVARAVGRDGGDIVLKYRRAADATARVRREVDLLRRLSGIPGVPEIVEPPPGAPPGTVLAMRDVGGEPLGRSVAARPMDPGELLGFAAALAELVGAVHRRGVIHKDINPANILVVGVPRRPVLIDFDLATTVALERPGFTHVTGIEGTLPYLAPEQTGRTGWAVDRRADLYALGATLYELATGAPPFGADREALALVHAHLTQVPEPISRRNPALPEAFGAVVAKLLEKEPHRRYQSAEGLAHDLGVVRAALAEGRVPDLVPGERDFPWRLTPPTRLVGREAELAALDLALQRACEDGCAGAVVAGGPGVGKSALLDQLKPRVTERGGWFASGRFDALRQGPATDGLVQALSSLARMLLSEPEGALAEVRARLLATLGADARHVGAVVPELEPLLGASTAPESAAKVGRLLFEALCAVARPQRPLVLVLDDLQWSSRLGLAFLDAAVESPPAPGLLVLGAYRDGEVDEAHPLAALLARWGSRPRPPLALALHNLPPVHVADLLAELLRLPPEPAGVLAGWVAPRTDGNPFDTIELVNALRREGVLAPGASGWSWDADEVRRYVRSSDPVELLAARIRGLPAGTGDLLGTLACLGEDIDLPTLRAATDAGVEALDPALEDGLLVIERSVGVRIAFRHDRVRQAALAQLGDRLVPRRLALARRLSDAHAALAAEQYLAASDAVEDPEERRRAARLFADAARNAVQLADLAAAERYLVAADHLTGGDALPTELHAVLIGLGRHEDADRCWARIDAVAGPLDAAAPAVRQIGSLVQRSRVGDALDLVCALLARLGHPVPDGEDALLAAIGEGVAELAEWVHDSRAEADLARADNLDPAATAVAAALNQLVKAAAFAGSPLMAWGVTEGVRLWRDHGPCADLVPVVAHAAYVTIGAFGDYANGYAAVQRAVAVAEGRGYDPATHHARALLALSAGPWFEPVEEALAQARRAREGLLRSGDLSAATFTFSGALAFEGAPELAEVGAEAEAGLAIAARTGNTFVAATLAPWRDLARRLAGSAPEGHAGESNPTADANAHVAAALAAALFGDRDALVAHAAASVPLRSYVEPTHLVYLSQAVHGLALAERLRDAPLEAREDLGAELETVRAWVEARAEDAPANFAWMARLLEAEHLAALSDFGAAVLAFDVAVRAATRSGAGWRAPFVLARAGRFQLEAGMVYAGRAALAEAARRTAEWGAVGLVQQLEREHPFLRDERAVRAGGTLQTTTAGMTADDIDMHAVLRASQAIGSATSLVRLQELLAEVLQRLTGATDVRLLRRTPAGWTSPRADGSGEILAPDEAPHALLRYVERTRSAVALDDAARDDRFARDPYLQGRDGRSLLCVPVLGRGEVTAAVLLENRRGRGVFGAARLGAVQMITGQLAVSLDNASMYADLERKVAERTVALQSANAELERLSVTDPLTGVVNRRRMTEVLEQEWHRPGPFSVVMLDIDHFKLYNDRYGHMGGDQCLRAVAKAIASAVRDRDTVARYGGEEFAVVLPTAERGPATAVAERIRAAVAALGIAHEGSPHGHVTVSVGVAAAGTDRGGRWEDLVKRADGALYESKRGGRDRVTAA